MADSNAPDWVVEALPFAWSHDLRWTWLHRGDELPNILWWHPCNKPGMRWIDVTSGKRHRIVAGGPGDEEHLTLEASVACHDCSIHGWVRDGKWVTA